MTEYILAFIGFIVILRMELEGDLLRRSYQPILDAKENPRR